MSPYIRKHFELSYKYVVNVYYIILYWITH